FSSRRRHTRSDRDWSSDVCSSDLVMERESFENEEIAKLLNKDFVSIKVDREERPDVDDIYMTAVQMINRSGGWPMSVWLTPDGKDRKSTRLNSSHDQISYAVFCLK